MSQDTGPGPSGEDPGQRPHRPDARAGQDAQAGEDAQAGQDAQAGPDVPARPDVRAGRRRAAGIYGAIITASIMTSAGGKFSTLDLALSVLITLVVYWLAEQYAEILGEHSAGGQLPTWRYIRAALGTSWPIVSASFAPLLVLGIASLAGASRSAAALAGALAAVLLLTFHGWTAGRSARLAGWRLAAVTCLAAALGLAMVALKDLVILHLH